MLFENKVFFYQQSIFAEDFSSKLWGFCGSSTWAPSPPIFYQFKNYHFQLRVFVRQTGGFLSDICKATATTCTSQERFSKFRTINGRCNNVQVIMWQIIRSGGSGFWIQEIQGFRFRVSGFQVQGYQDLEVSISWGFRVLDFQFFKL